MLKIEIKCKKSDKISNIMLNYGFSYNSINKLLRNKDVRIDNVKVNNDEFVVQDQTIQVYTQEEPAKKFEIVFEDDNIIIVNKFSGIEVEGEDGLEGKIEGAIGVHRLDRNTQGLLVMAKNKNAENQLTNAIKLQKLKKKYLAEVVGKSTFNGKVYTGYIVKDAKTAFVKVFNNFVQNSVKIETRFTTVKVGAATSVVEAELITGKTHQIRAHLSFLGYPILGDGKYGKNEINKKYKEKFQKLHCFYLQLNGLNDDLNSLNGRVFTCYPKWYKK